MFWGLFLQDPANLFESVEVANSIPPFAHHSAHTLPSTSLILDLFFTPSVLHPDMPLFLKFFFPALITFFYCIQTLSIGFIFHDPKSEYQILAVQWPYGFMNKLDLKGWIILIFGVFTLIFVVQCILHFIRKFIVGLFADKKEKKKKTQ